MNIRDSVLRLTGAAMVTLAVAPWVGASAASASDLDSGDPRATAYAGNATSCSGGQNPAELPGDIIAVTSTQDGTYIDVTAVPSGATVTGVVVKGGDAYNVYLPGALGGLPWIDLHAPLNGSGQPAGISHWFVCATETEQSTPVETTPVETTPVETTPVETTGEETTPVETTPVETTPVETTAEETTAEETTAEETTAEETTAEETTAEETEPEVSVEPTKVGSSPEVSVQGVKAGLAATGAGLPLPALLGASFALLLAGSALMVLPGRPVTERGRHRRH